MPEVFTEEERQELREARDEALDKPLRRMRKRFKHLKTEVNDLEVLLRKNSDGIWDAIEGAVVDAQHAVQGMVEIVKNVNKYRDSRSQGPSK